MGWMCECMCGDRGDDRREGREREIVLKRKKRRDLGCAGSDNVLWGAACPPRSPRKLVEAARRLAG